MTCPPSVLPLPTLAIVPSRSRTRTPEL
jgi:hypothetical protein